MKLTERTEQSENVLKPGHFLRHMHPNYLEIVQLAVSSNEFKELL